MDAEYNDIVRWKYSEIPEVFGAVEGKGFRKYIVKTKDELEKLLKDAEFQKGKGLQFVELWMEKGDAPRGLKITTEISARNNARTE